MLVTETVIKVVDSNNKYSFVSRQWLNHKHYRLSRRPSSTGHPQSFAPYMLKSTITIFPLQDEGTFQMKQPARDLLKRLGSKRAQVIGWRDMWAMVTQKGAKMFGESYSKSTEFNTWGAPVVLRTEVPLVPVEGIYVYIDLKNITDMHNVCFIIKIIRITLTVQFDLINF